MKRFALLLVASLVAVGLVPAAAGAGTAAPASVTIVHAATFGFPEGEFGSDFPVYICVDGGDVFETAAVLGDSFGPLELPAGTYDVAIFPGAESCQSKTILADEVTVDPGDDVTVAAIYTSQGPSIVVWDNDSSCYEPATSSRLTVRHGAATGGPVDVVGFVDGSETRSTIISDLPEGGQQTEDLPGGTLAEFVSVVPAGGDQVFVQIPSVEFEAGQHLVVYAAGGDDGAVGVFVEQIPMEPCEVPVDPTTPAPTPAAAAVTAAPRFTG
ncbi:MAG: DUF4397 domain-containing protein [Acidimicrobiales bacterium]|jgi:hypothetical protein|nr:DUF4397 domain-containing protein [Acidimicrobiales bacterium]